MISIFNKLLRIYKFLQLKLEDKYNNKEFKGEDDLLADNIDDIKITLEKYFSECSDFNFREVVLNRNIKSNKTSKTTILIAYIDGLINKDLVNRDILKPIMQEVKGDESELSIDTVSYLKEKVLSISELTEVIKFKQAVNLILSGDTLIFIDGKRVALKVGTRGWETRGVEEPSTEVVVRGPREGFTETLRTNTALLRRRIKNPNLKFEMMTLGKQTNTDICICYIKNLIHEDIIKTLRRRLKKINTDAILESGYVEEFIEDAPFSIFSTVGNSEKPDVVAGKILEGRAAVLCDGTPFVLTVPHLFIETLISAEDYYSRPYIATLIRWLRILAFFITVSLPAYYVASVAFHQDVIPFKLLLTIVQSREGIPFSVFTETLLMAITYELLREAGVRMPRPIGQAVSIVGALVLGQAAVDSGIASNPVIMVTAITAITSFILPPLRGTVPFLRLFLLFAANIIGYMGILVIFIIIYIHMCTLRSFGVPYMAPFSPLYGMDLKDTFIRVPLWSMWLRPRSLMLDHQAYVKKGFRMKKDIKTKED